MKPKEQRRRRVLIDPSTPSGGTPKMWGFGYRDYAELFGISEDAIRDMAKRGFDFGDLEQVCAEWLKRKSSRLVRDGNW